MVIQPKIVSLASVGGLVLLYLLLASTPARADALDEVLLMEANQARVSQAVGSRSVASDAVSVQTSRTATVQNVGSQSSTGTAALAGLFVLSALVLAAFNCRRGRKSTDAAIGV